MSKIIMPTPGPWRATKFNDTKSWSLYANGVPHSLGSIKKEADANLAAAAPEMLDALDPDTLEAIADEIDCFKHSARASGLRGLAYRQRAAIAKATGGSDA